MIKFFRRIRQQLLSQNKFSKYLLYAIGEIVLVVIGILIALQLNNWNEDRKQKVKERSYLKELKSSLKKDSIQITEVIEFNAAKLKVVRNMMSIFSEGLSNDERMRIFVENSSDFVHYNVFEPSATVFNNMVSAETINMIRDNELKKELSSYYEYDYRGGIQERVRITNRKVIDNFFPLFITRENVMAMTNLETEMPLNEDVEIHKNQYFLSELYGIQALINLQNDFLEYSQDQIELINKLIGRNLN